VLTTTPRSPPFSGSFFAISAMQYAITWNVPTRLTITVRANLRQFDAPPVPVENFHRRGNAGAVDTNVNRPKRSTQACTRMRPAGLVGDVDPPVDCV